MERLISLFREADYEKWSASAPRPAANDAAAVGLGDDEPLYFKQLLQYLREQRRESKPSETGARAAQAADLIGARA